MSYHHLTRETRHTIASLKAQGDSSEKIARTIGCHRSTIDRELKHNATPSGGYAFTKAHKQATNRSKAASCRQMRMPSQSEEFIREKLTTLQWSPEQIANKLEENQLPKVSHESI